MEVISVIVAAIGGFALGAAWYAALSGPWAAASGIKLDDGRRRPARRGKAPLILAGVAMILVAGMMRHVFATSGIDTLAGGLVSGLGVGLFFISPWIMINNAYGDRPFSLTLIDGGYATCGCAVIGAILGIL